MTVDEVRRAACEKDRRADQILHIPPTSRRRAIDQPVAERFIVDERVGQRMWVLLPKGLRIAAQQTSLKTRGGGPAASDADCLVSDPVLCVDDAP
ncbi:hypothetical protein QFZ98_001813 [Paraburkholderia youngii]